MKRRRFVQALTALPSAPALVLPALVAPGPAGAQQTGYGQGGGRPTDELPKLDQFSVPDAAAEPVPHFFSARQLAALRRLSDLIVPRLGDTPGALDARAPEFLDFLIANSPPDRKEIYRAGLDALNAQTSAKFGKAFAEVDAREADQILAPLRERWTYTSPASPLAAFLHAAKADILAATSNSREWIEVVSKRNRGAGGMSLYWHPIA